MTVATEKKLAEITTLHIMRDVPDPKTFLKERGEQIRAVVTSCRAGFPSEYFDLLPRLEIISCFSVGTDSIDVKLAKSKGISVTNTPDVLTDDVADLALGLILSVSRQLVGSDKYIRQGGWARHGMYPITRRVTGKRVGIIGLGRIGLAIAKRAAAFDCPIAYHSRNRKPEGDALGYTYFDSVVPLAAASDFLVAICPLTPETQKIVGKEVLDALGSDGIFINVARGGVVDEEELVKALVEGRIGGAGLDVFANEPHVPEQLLQLENVVLLPHVGSGTVETRTAMGDLVISNLQAHFSGCPLLTPI
eukprot:TRINITY_DN2247_c0_g1_i4.p1 TRINITY_DN2247_c0_g1~~TRINITY_DN2247_c0_g1_i4.p1  ORF type:complete len:316 (-),score=80.50 TRINITY_DN2247_c0_g1_i4:75-992(-)